MNQVLVTVRILVINGNLKKIQDFEIIVVINEEMKVGILENSKGN